MTNNYTYKAANNIPISTIIDFYQLIQGLEIYRQKIVSDNIDMRLSKIDIKVDYNALPF